MSPVRHVPVAGGEPYTPCLIVAVQSNRSAASLPGVGGMQFRLLKCVETHETMHPHTMNQKTAKYSTKNATRTFCGYGANLG